MNQTAKSLLANSTLLIARYLLPREPRGGIPFPPALLKRLGMNKLAGEIGRHLGVVPDKELELGSQVAELSFLP